MNRDQWLPQRLIKLIKDSVQHAFKKGQHNCNGAKNTNNTANVKE